MYMDLATANNGNARLMTQATQSPPIAAPHKELRESPRMKRNEQVTITLYDGVEASITATLQDLSPTGFSFCSPRHIEPGQLCAITLPRGHGDPVVIICKTINCRPLDHGKYRVGSMFVRTIAKSAPRRR